ncbi:MAG: STAS domain-containing protein [Calditrichae bacterium]|nr:STAS domain-containing protein [Calditrichota bacterium]MCB9089842.1 STAS domain-containing protein [Calditrichia bacterium]
MEFSYHQTGEVVQVKICGEVGQENIPELMKQMRLLLTKDFREVVFDLTEVPGITSAMIGKFLMFYKNTAARGIRMRINGVNKGIYGYFQTLRINELFPVEP